MNKYLIVFGILFRGFSSLYSQDLEKSKSLYLSISASYMELKDDINFGLVYAGPDGVIDFGYAQWISELDDCLILDTCPLLESSPIWI